MAAVVNIYIETNITGIKPTNGNVITVLEFIAQNGKRATKTIQNELTNSTAKQAVLIALNTAISQLNRSCYITLYITNPYVYESIGKKRVQQWKENHWKNAKGEEVAYRKYWEDYFKLSKLHNIYITSGSHPYHDWMCAQLKEKEEKTCTR